MKVLRVLRRRKIRLSFIFILLLVFVFNTYAWMSFDRTAGTGGAITANVSSWAVEFLITEENLKVEEYTYEIEEFYPGVTTTIPIEKRIEVYNVGEANSNLEYTVKEIYLYGEQILKNGATEDEMIPETIGTEVENADGTYTKNVFGNQDASIFDEGNSNYTFSLNYPTPFTISYTYDKKYIYGSNGEISSKAWMTLNLAWYNDEDNNEEDTKLGNLAYEYKLANPDEPALKLVVEVKASRDNV